MESAGGEFSRGRRDDDMSVLELQDPDEGQYVHDGREAGELARRLTYLREILAHSVPGTDGRDAAVRRSRLLAEIARVEGRLGNASMRGR